MSVADFEDKMFKVTKSGSYFSNHFSGMSPCYLFLNNLSTIAVKSTDFRSSISCLFIIIREVCQTKPTNYRAE